MRGGLCRCPSSLTTVHETDTLPPPGVGAAAGGSRRADMPDLLWHSVGEAPIITPILCPTCQMRQKRERW